MNDKEPQPVRRLNLGGAANMQLRVHRVQLEESSCQTATARAR